MSRDIIFPNDAVHNVNVNVKDFVPGKPGKSPYIGDDGYWYIYDEATDSWVKTDVYAKAADDAKADAEAAATQASYYRDIALTAKNEANAFSQDAYLYRNQAVSAKNDAVYAKVDAQSAQTAAETAQDNAEYAADRAEAAAAMFDEDVEGYVDDWLDAHPEVTTTVQDGSLTEAKFSDALKLKTIKDYVTPEMFGAVGDGIADDTTELQSCISNGKNVVLTGTYRITAPLNFNSKHDIWVFGGKITRDQNQTFNTIVGSGADNIHFVGVTFDGNGNDRNMTYTWPDGVQACIKLASQCKNIYVEDCKVLNFNYGIFILGADVENSPSSFDNTSMNGVIRNCEFYNCHSGIATYGKSTLIDHNIFYNNTGISVQLEANNTAQDIDNPITDNNYFNSVTGATLSNNLFIDNANTDISVFPNAYGVSIFSNLHINFYQALTVENGDGSKGTNVHHNTYIGQKSQSVDSNKRPYSYTAAVVLLGKVTFDNNAIYSAVVGIFNRGNAIISNNIIDKPHISGIAVYDNLSVTGISILRGNTITRHSTPDGAWWGCRAIHIGKTLATLYILDTVIYTTNGRPIAAESGTAAIVKNLLSNVESLAIDKPTGVYDYSN